MVSDVSVSMAVFEAVSTLDILYGTTYYLSKSSNQYCTALGILASRPWTRMHGDYAIGLLLAYSNRH